MYCSPISIVKGISSGRVDLTATLKQQSRGPLLRAALAIAWILCESNRLLAQLPFYTDDTAVTEPGAWHLEFFNEYDALQLQYPNQRQNTANIKLNYGLPHRLEVDVDSPYLSIDRAAGNHSSTGVGDTNLGIKKTFREESAKSRLPALAASFYIEFPTGDVSQQLGSGLRDYWLNLIAQKSLSTKTRITGNLGYLFAGDTTTGALGTNAQGHVFPGGVSLQHDFLPSLTLGAEVFGAYSPNEKLGKAQLQAMTGGHYVIRRGLSLCFGLLGGMYVASPRLGAQIGFALDLPRVIDATGH